MTDFDMTRICDCGHPAPNGPSPTPDGERARRNAILDVAQARADRAALERVRELHRPVTWPAEPPSGAHPDAECFDGPVTVCAAESDDPAGRTHWAPWPCATICALDDIPTYSNPGNALDDPTPTDTTGTEPAA